MNKKVFFVTNNSTKTRQELADKAKALNFNVGFVRQTFLIFFENAEKNFSSQENMISTAYLSAQFLKQKNFNKKVYVIGSVGITKELDAVGIKSYGVGSDVLNAPLLSLMEENFKDPEVGAVVVGFDEHIR